MRAGCRGEAVQVRGDPSHLQGRERRDGHGDLRRLHGGVQDVRPRGPGLHLVSRDAHGARWTRYVIIIVSSFILICVTYNTALMMLLLLLK